MVLNPKNFSFYDLMQYPKFAKAAKDNDKKLMEEVLWEIGVDITKEYTMEWCIHRALTTNIPQEGWYIVGAGRRDKEWLESGVASKEDYIAAAKQSLRNDLLNMGREGAYTVEKEYESVNYDKDKEFKVGQLEGEEIKIDVEGDYC